VEEYLTEDEEAWLAQFAKVVYKGYACGHPGQPQVQIRSAVFRGALSVLQPLMGKYERDRNHELFQLGEAIMLESLPNVVR
jgi:hypothetical protein